MSSIQGVQSSTLQQVLRSQATTLTSGARSSRQPVDAKLDAALSSQGLSAEDRASLKTDLRTTLDETFNSGTFPPDPAKIQAAVTSVFEKYGISADKMAATMGPPGMGGGPRPGAGPGPTGGSQEASSASGYEDDSTTTLLDALKELVANLSDQSGSSASSDATDYLLSALVGFDVQA